MAEIRSRRGLRGREREPEGLGEAVAAGALMLALMTALATVGFAWERAVQRSAHAFAVELIRRVALDGSDALLPPWSGLGQGPRATTAKATFEAMHRLGGFEATSAGACVPASQFALCRGSRYRCHVVGDTPSGPVTAAIGICRGGASGAAWTFDTLDLTIPADGSDPGNRADVDASEGAIRYGSTPPAPEPLARRSRRRGFALPFLWAAPGPGSQSR